MTQGRYVTLCYPKMHPNLGFLPQIIEIYSIHDYSKNSFKRQGHSDSEMVQDTPLFLDTKFRIPTFENVGDMHQTGSVMEGQPAYYMPPKVTLGHKKVCPAMSINFTPKKCSLEPFCRVICHHDCYICLLTET